MKPTWTLLVCSLALSLTVCAPAQNNDSSNDQNHPALKTRPNDTNPPSQPNPSSQPPASSTTYGQNSTYGASPNAIPEGTRFIIKLKDTLDTKKMDQGKHFKAELREDLVTPSGLLIPKGRTVKGHVGSYERGYTGARMLLALDEIETRHGWVPLIGTVTGVPGDPSVKSTENEGEISRKGPDKKRVIENAAIGAGVGAVSGAVIGGSKGAAIGAAAGAGLGTGAGLLFRGNDIKLDKGTQLEVRLNRDLTVPTESR
jgi:Glycine-zipper domain